MAATTADPIACQTRASQQILKLALGLLYEHLSATVPFDRFNVAVSLSLFEMYELPGHSRAASG
jgi:hypothetical protein